LSPFLSAVYFDDLTDEVSKCGNVGLVYMHVIWSGVFYFCLFLNAISDSVYLSITNSVLFNICLLMYRVGQLKWGQLMATLIAICW